MNEWLLGQSHSPLSLCPHWPSKAPTPSLSEPQTLRNLLAGPPELPGVSGSVPMLSYLRPQEAVQPL